MVTDASATRILVDELGVKGRRDIYKTLLGLL
jgi:hypothetical protein